MKLLWFAWVWSLCTIGTINCLHVMLSPNKIFYGLDRIGTDLLFGSLDYLNKSTTMNLPRLLLVKGKSVKADYYKASLSEAVAKELVKSFINFPNLHPIVLPFPLYSRNIPLQDALASRLHLYRPEVLDCFNVPDNIHVDSQDLLVIAKSIPNLFVHTDSTKIIRQLIEADYETYQGFFELGDWTFYEFSPTERIEKYGELFGFISILHTFLDLSAIQKQNGDLRYSLEETLLNKATQYFAYFSSYFKHLESWKYDYAWLSEKVWEECRKQKLNRCKIAFWQGRLLEIYAHHEYSQVNELEEFYLSYLNFYSSKSIPHIVLFSLKRHANAKGLVIRPEFIENSLLNFNINENAMLAVEYLDTVFSFGSGMRDDISSHINRVYNFNRHTNRIKKLRPPLCNPCTTAELIKWWGEFDDLKSIILVSSNNFPVINIKRTIFTTVCRDLSSLLNTISEIFLSNIESSIYTIDVRIFEKAIIRTVAYSLLYRIPIKLKLDKGTIDALYGDVDAGYVCIFNGNLLRQIGFDKIPRALFMIETYPQTIIQRFTDYVIQLIGN